MIFTFSQQNRHIFMSFYGTGCLKIFRALVRSVFKKRYAVLARSDDELKNVRSLYVRTYGVQFCTRYQIITWIFQYQAMQC